MITLFLGGGGSDASRGMSPLNEAICDLSHKKVLSDLIINFYFNMFIPYRLCMQNFISL